MPHPEHGHIATRADFSRMLEQAREFAATQPGAIEPSVLKAIVEQLGAMQQWSANSQTPTEQQRQSICIGLIAARELGQLTDPLATKFVSWLHELNNYFEDWP